MWWHSHWSRTQWDSGAESECQPQETLIANAMSNSVCLPELARTQWDWIWMPTTRHIERELNEAPRYSTRILRVTCVPKELCEEVFETCHELNRSSRFRANSMRYSMQCGWHSDIAPESCVSNVYARSYVKKSLKLATNSMSHSVSCHLSTQGVEWKGLLNLPRTQWVTACRATYLSKEVCG